MRIWCRSAAAGMLQLTGVTHIYLLLGGPGVPRIGAPKHSRKPLAFAIRLSIHILHEIRGIFCQALLPVLLPNLGHRFRHAGRV
jgi:hypothetical protein